MNRCFHLFCAALLSTLLSLGCLVAGAQEQISPPPPAPLPALQDLPPDPQRIPPISPRAKFGVLRVVAPPDALLDGKPARLSPGARIRGTNNLLVMSAAVAGQDLKVLYTLEPMGLVHEVWILTLRETVIHTPPKPLPTDSH